MEKSVTLSKKIALKIGEKQITDYIFDKEIGSSLNVIILKSGNTLFWYDRKTGIKLSEVENIEYVEILNETICIKVDGLYGVYSFDGEMLLPCDYNFITPLDCTKADLKVKLNNKIGIYSIEKNNFVIPIEFDDVKVGFGYYEVIKDNLKGAYSYKGKKIINVKYSYINATSVFDYYIVADRARKLGLFHKRKKVLPCEYDGISRTAVYKVFQLTKEGTLCYFVTGDNKIVNASGVSTSGVQDEEIFFYQNHKWRNYSEIK